MQGPDLAGTFRVTPEHSASLGSASSFCRMRRELRHQGGGALIILASETGEIRVAGRTLPELGLQLRTLREMTAASGRDGAY